MSFISPLLKRLIKNAHGFCELVPCHQGFQIGTAACVCAKESASLLLIQLQRLQQKADLLTQWVPLSAVVLADSGILQSGCSTSHPTSIFEKDKKNR
jgi:ABC-type uncharacterized transport system YnjBCD permease subunit